MKISKYNLGNWRELLDKDWDYLRKDFSSNNVENIMSKILKKQRRYIQEDIISVRSMLEGQGLFRLGSYRWNRLIKFLGRRWQISRPVMICLCWMICVSVTWVRKAKLQPCLNPWVVWSTNSERHLARL